MSPPPPDASCLSVYDDHPLTLSYTTRAHVEYDLRIGDGDGGGYPSDFIALNRLTVSAEDGGEACHYYFLMRPGAAKLVITPLSGATPQILPLDGSVLEGRWTHLSMDLEDVAKTGAPSVRVGIDGVEVLASTPVMAGCLPGRVTAVTPGLFCVNSSTSREAETRGDNLIVQVK